MKKRNRRLIGLIAAMMAVTLLPVLSFGDTALIVTLDKTEISVTEGKIHTDEEARVKASTSVSGAGGSLVYQWYECTASGELKSPVDGRYVQMDNDGLTMRIPETLTEGTYYYLCNVKLLVGETAAVAEEKNSNVVTVVVAEGTPVVILDPNGGAFAEIMNNTQPLDVMLDADGKVPADKINMMTGKEGWKFVGWYTGPDGGEQVDLAKEVFTHTTRLYAHYDVEKTVTFDASGGSFGEGVTEYHVNFTGDFFAKDQLPPEPTRQGYIFAGWYMKGADGEEYQLTPISGMDGYEFPSDGMVIYAKWDKAEAPEPNEPKQEPLDESPAAGDDMDVMPWVMAAGLAVLAGSTVRFRKKSM